MLRYSVHVIKSFRHKGLRQFFETGSKAGIRPDQAGRWSITVQANWRITFEFDDGDAYILDYEDYH